MNRTSEAPIEQSKRLLVVGPLPPPIGGGATSVRLFLVETHKYGHLKTSIINTSPKQWVKDHSIVTMEKLSRSTRIVFRYLKAVKGTNAIILFATHSFIFTIGILLMAIARIFRVPFYIKPLGAEIGKRYELQTQLIRRGMLAILKNATGVMFQTEGLQRNFISYGMGNAYYIPGYRAEAPLQRRPAPPSAVFRIVFISQIVREKGALLLLAALNILLGHAAPTVECDFYGPIGDEDSQPFWSLLEKTPGSKYCGTADCLEVPVLMAGYDALVFPTCRWTEEGHPGVLIEAMQAGLPVISSRFESASELIIDGWNGLLVPLGNCDALADAIKRLAMDRHLREAMGRANKEAGKRFRSDSVVADMIALVLGGPNTCAKWPPLPT